MNATSFDRAMFAIRPADLWSAVDDALSTDVPPQGNLSPAARALASFLGMAQPEFVGHRWDLVDPPTDDPESTYWATSTTYASLIHRLIYRLSPHIRLLTVFPLSPLTSILITLGTDRSVTSAMLHGGPLYRRVDPNPGSMLDDELPVEMAILDQSRAEVFHAAAQQAIGSYASANAELAERTAAWIGIRAGDSADRQIYSMLTSLLSALELLMAGDTEILAVGWLT